MLGLLRGLKGLAGWKMYLIIGVAATTIGFAGGIRWEQGAQLADAKKALEELSVQAQQALVSLGSAWDEEAAKAQLEVSEWNAQNENDRALIRQLIVGQAEIRNQFEELDNEITIVTDFGTCELSPNAVRLLRAASERTRAAELPND